MITIEEKRKMWQKVTKEFPSDSMLRNLHFIRELMTTLRKQAESKSCREISLSAREEFADWLKAHPESAEE